MLARVHVDEERVDGVEHLGGAGVLPVDLVDHHHRREAERERLAEHESRLRQRSLGRVHEQEHSVDEAQTALDLAAEVGVARRIDDVDLHAAIGDGGVLRQDGDALLALELVRVHGAVHQGLVGAEDAGLSQHEVDQRGLAVVDVRDDRDVPDLLSGKHARECAL